MKEITIKIDEVTAEYVATTLEYYNLYILEEAEKRDTHKVNTPFIKMIKRYLEAYKKAKEEATK